MCMSIFTILILSFLFSLAFFTIALFFFKSFVQKRERQEFKKTNEDKDIKNSIPDDVQQEKDRLKKRLTSLRSSEEMLQSREKELELSFTELQQTNVFLEKKTSEISQRINELDLREENILREKEKLEILSKRKSEVMTNMSHELKTPLNSILTLTQVMLKNKEENLTSSQTKYLKTVYASGKTLLSLINDILDLAKAESGRTDIYIEAIELNTIRQEIMDTFYIHQEKHQIHFSIEIAENTPDFIYSDKKRLLQILRNIISNAFKYTEKGFVRVLIEKHNIKEHPLESIMSIEDYMVFSVEDSGIGIEKEKQQVIFEEFVQADTSSTRSYSGTGLGLAISLRYAKLLGGDIRLESNPGKGSKFVIYLPSSENNLQKKIQSPKKNKDEPQVAVEIAETAMGKKLKNKKILIINTDMRFLFHLTNLLEAYQAQIIATDNLDDGLRKLQIYSDISIVAVSENIAAEKYYRLIDEISSNTHPGKIKVFLISETDKSEELPEENIISGILNKNTTDDSLIKILSEYSD